MKDYSKYASLVNEYVLTHKVAVSIAAMLIVTGIGYKLTSRNEIYGVWSCEDHNHDIYFYTYKRDGTFTTKGIINGRFKLDGTLLTWSATVPAADNMEIEGQKNVTKLTASKLVTDDVGDESTKNDKNWADETRQLCTKEKSSYYANLADSTLTDSKKQAPVINTNKDSSSWITVFLGGLIIIFYKFRYKLLHFFSRADDKYNIGSIASSSAAKISEMPEVKTTIDITKSILRVLFLISCGLLAIFIAVKGYDFYVKKFPKTNTEVVTNNQEKSNNQLNITQVQSNQENNPPTSTTTSKINSLLNTYSNDKITIKIVAGTAKNRAKITSSTCPDVAIYPEYDTSSAQLRDLAGRFVIYALGESQSIEIESSHECLPSGRYRALSADEIAARQASAVAQKGVSNFSESASYALNNVTIHFEVGARGENEFTSSLCPGTTISPSQYDNQTKMSSDDAHSYSIGFSDDYATLIITGTHACLPAGTYQRTDDQSSATNTAQPVTSENIKVQQQEDKNSQFYLGLQAANKHDYVTAVQWYTKAAELGHAGAQYKLAQILKNTLGGDENFALANMYYYLATLNGYVDANPEVANLNENNKAKAEQMASEWLANHHLTINEKVSN